MFDPNGFLQQLAVPRPNGLTALPEVAALIQRTLFASGSRPVGERFFLRPYLSTVVGLVLLFLALGVVFAIRRRRRLLAFCLALAIPVVYLCEFEFNLPLVSWAGGGTGRNIVVAFGSPQADRTLILSAHYDTKTELFDHEQRKPIYSAAMLSMVALLLAGLMSLFAYRVRVLDRPRSRRLLMAMAAAGAAGLFALALSFGGGYLVRDKSPGVRDDGTSVAILAGLADALNQGTIRTGQTRVKLVFFAGEEANMQGSRAFVARNRAELGQAAVINLECMSGLGPYRYYGSTGTYLRKFAPSPELKVLLDRALADKGLPPAVPGGSVFDDAASFAAAGVPVLTIYNEIPGRPDSYHDAGDDLAHVAPGRMEEAVGLLGRAIEFYGEG